MKRKRILLLNLPNYCPNRKFYSLPLGLAYLAASLNKRNYILKGLDLAATKEKNASCYLNSPKKYLNKIVKFNPDYVLIGCLVHNRFNVFYWSELIKKCVRGSKIIIGNHFASTKPKEILENIPWIDYVILGEGDKIIYDLVKGIEGSNLDGVGNIAFRKSSGKVVVRRNKTFLGLETLPFPKRNIFNKDEYVFNIGGKRFSNVASILSSRGCSMQCSFCSSRVFEGNIYRTRNISNILEEIKTLKKIYSIFMFIDDTFTINKNHIIEFCKKVSEEKLNIKWICWSCLNIDLSILDFMKKAGCVFISFGLESASSEILRRFKKNITINHAKRIIEKCKKIGIDARFTLLVNSGYETRETIKETLHFLKQLKINRNKIDHADGVWVFPGTDLEKEFLSEKNEVFDWFKPKNSNFIVQKDNAGNHLVPLFKSLEDKKIYEIFIKY